MKNLFLFLTLTVASSWAFANTQKLENCLDTYAQNEVEEHNLPNESMISASEQEIESVRNVLTGMKYADTYTKKGLAVLADAEAVGLVIQYSDEVQLIYVKVSVENGQCKVQNAFDVNIADISGTDSGFTPKDAPVFFLNKTKSELKKIFGDDSTITDIFEAVEESLGY